MSGRKMEHVPKCRLKLSAFLSIGQKHNESEVAQLCLTLCDPMDWPKAQSPYFLLFSIFQLFSTMHTYYINKRRKIKSILNCYL